MEQHYSPESLSAIATTVQLALLQPILGPCNIASSNPPSISARWTSLNAFNLHLISTINIKPKFVFISLKYVQRIISLRSSNMIDTSNMTIRNTSDEVEKVKRVPTDTAVHTACFIAPVQNPQHIITLSPRSLILTSFMMALKIYDDRRILNKVYAKIGGIELEILNKVERECLCALGYNLQIDPNEYNVWEESIWKYIVMEMSPILGLMTHNLFPNTSERISRNRTLNFDCYG